NGAAVEDRGRALEQIAHAESMRELQWGRGRRPRKSAPCAPWLCAYFRFNGAAVEDRGRGAGAGRAAIPARRFNGAAVEDRGRGVIEQQVPQLAAASMGPRSKTAEESSRRVSTPTSSRFNGAAVEDRGRGVGAGLLLPTLCQLQWGRG